MNTKSYTGIELLEKLEAFGPEIKYVVGDHDNMYHLGAYTDNPKDALYICSFHYSAIGELKQVMSVLGFKDMEDVK